MTNVNILSILSCTACQNRCDHCAHEGMMADDRSYQMGMDEVTNLIRRMEELDLRVHTLSFGGPGEPLLWRHFNQAVPMVAATGRCDIIEATTNGRLISRISAEAWDALTYIQISEYGYPLDEIVVAAHASKVRRLPRGEFRYVDESRLPCPPATGCLCPGNMYYKGHIWPECGPVLFDAASRAKMDPWSMAIPLVQWEPTTQWRPGLPCSWCWANPNAPTITVPWSPSRERH